MLDSIPTTLLISTALGFLSGIGIGGGSLLILWLTMVLHTDPLVARSINLLFFIPAALVSSILRRKQSKPDWKCILPAALSGCAAALVFSWLGTGLDTGLLKKLFSGLLLITGLRELFYRPRKAR